MHLHLLPILYIVVVCWLSTALIIFLDSLPPHTFRWSFGGATLLMLVAVWWLAATRDDRSVAGVYIAFTSSTIVYGWHKMSFYMGFIDGPRRTACPHPCGGPRHFMHAVQTILYHELVVIASALGLVALTWNQQNQVGLWTFLILWWMQQCARLNIFWGVRNLNADLLPPHLHYLGRYFTKKPINPFFPLSITIPSIVAMLLLGRAFTSPASDVEAISLTFLGFLIVAAVFELMMLMVPLPERWLQRQSKRAAQPQRMIAIDVERKPGPPRFVPAPASEVQP
jgi:putative photosynthetic complex assembly protein 2